MTDVKEIDPVDFAGAVAHMAAGQLYGMLAETDPDLEQWYGSFPDADVADDINGLAHYASRTSCAGETLWRHGTLGLIVAVDVVGDYMALPVARRLAFDMFAAVVAIAHDQVTSLQRAAGVVPVAEPAGLRLEDSVFEPHGSMAEIEPHQAQFLKDQAVMAEAKAKADASQVAADESISLGTSHEAEPERPASISIGKFGQEGAAGEEGDTDTGSEVGDADAADRAVQGDISGLSDEDAAAPDPAGQGLDDSVSEDGAAAELASPVAERSGLEAGAAAEGRLKPVTKTAKLKKTKSAK